MIDREEFEKEYIHSIFGSYLDEYDMPYKYVYRFEISHMFDDLFEDISYLEELKPQLENLRMYIKCILILSARTFIRDASDIYSIALIDQLAYKLAKKVVKGRKNEKEN